MSNLLPITSKKNQESNYLCNSPLFYHLSDVSGCAPDGLCVQQLLNGCVARHPLWNASLGACV